MAKIHASQMFFELNSDKSTILTQFYDLSQSFGLILASLCQPIFSLFVVTSAADVAASLAHTRGEEVPEISNE